MVKRHVCPDSGKLMTADRHALAVCCPACGGYVRLTQDGKIRRHMPAEGAAVRHKKSIDAIKEFKANQKGRQ